MHDSAGGESVGGFFHFPRPVVYSLAISNFDLYCPASPKIKKLHKRAHRDDEVDGWTRPRGGDGRHFDLPFVHTDFVFPVCVFLGGADSHPRPHPTPSTALYGYYHICCYPRASGAAISAGHREQEGNLEGKQRVNHL